MSPALGSSTATTPTHYHSRALSDMPGCVITLGAHGRILYANDSAQAIMGIEPYVGMPLGAYFSDNAREENDEFYDLLLEAVRDKDERHQGRCPFVTPDGDHLAFFVTSSLVSDEDGESFLVMTCTDVTAEVELERKRNESAFVFLSSIAYICIVVFCYAFWNYFGQPFPPAGFTVVLEVLGIILGFIVFMNTSLTLSDLGLGTNNLARNLKVDGIACVVIVIAMCGLKLLLMNVAPSAIKHPEAFIDLSWVPFSRFASYILTALVQEFLSRGIMQESLTHVIPGERGETVAIAISTLMFAAIHLHYTPWFMIGAAVLLGVFGVVYRKQRSIWGLVLIHFVFGISAAFLGLI